MSIEQKLEAAEKLAAEAKKLFESGAYAKAAAADKAAAAAYRELFQALNSPSSEIDNNYGCQHCGVETEVLDTDGLCTPCAKEQEEYDNGECPICGTPSPGSRECYDC